MRHFLAAASAVSVTVNGVRRRARVHRRPCQPHPPSPPCEVQTVPSLRRPGRCPYLLPAQLKSSKSRTITPPARWPDPVSRGAGNAEEWQLQPESAGLTLLPLLQLTEAIAVVLGGDRAVAQLDVVAQRGQRCDGFGGRVAHVGGGLHAAPSLAPIRERVSPCTLVIYAGLPDQHVEDVFQGGTEPGSTYREVQIRHPRYRGALGNPPGHLLSTGRSTTGSRHHKCKSVPMPVDLNVSSGDIA